MQLSKADIDRLFAALDEELAKEGAVGEVYVVGGAVMCVVFNARASTVDVDALFRPTASMRRAAKRVATRYDVGENWLNDASKGYMSAHGDYSIYVEREHLRVFVAKPEYILAMKCLAMRLGEEFHDLDDVRFLLRLLNISTYDVACEMISRYYPLEKFPQKTLYALAELLSGSGAQGNA